MLESVMQNMYFHNLLFENLPRLMVLCISEHNYESMDLHINPYLHFLNHLGNLKHINEFLYQNLHKFDWDKLFIK